MLDQVCAYVQNVLGTLVCLFIIRIFIVYTRIHRKKKTIPRTRVTAKLMIVLGSGGHTHEILHLLKNSNHQIQPRIYVLADTDILSEKKAKKFEEIRSSQINYNPSEEIYLIEKIPRSREVGQSWISTIFTTLKAFISSLHLVYRHMPDAVVCNGPGTCIPICFSSLLLHILCQKHITIIYIESVCRVKTLSLTGKILYFIADHFFVNWPELKAIYPRAEYIGLLF